MPEDTELSNGVERILAQFPGPVKLSEDRLTGISFGLAALMFVGIGALLFAIKSNQQSQPGLLVATLFFGALVIQLLISFLPGRGQITLDSNGMDISYGVFRWKHRWADVSEISLYWGSLVFNSRASERTVFGRLNRLVAPTNSFIPNLYVLSPDEMVQLLTQWQHRALRQKAN